MVPTSTIGRNRSAKRNQYANPERLYKEASAARKVKQYLDHNWTKIIKEEDRLLAVSKNLEPPPAPNSAPTARRPNGDNVSIHSSPGLSIKNMKPGKNHHSRTGSEPTITSPLMPLVSVTKGHSRTMVPVSELPKFGAENSNSLNKLMSLAESGNVSRYGERRRYRSGQSDSSVNTSSTTYTQHSAPIIQAPRGSRPRKPKPSGLPAPSPSAEATPKAPLRSKEKTKKTQRPLSEHLNQSLSVAREDDQPRETRRRQRSVDQSRELKMESSVSSKTKGSRCVARSTPDLLGAPINPIYQPRDRESAGFITKI